MDSPFEYQRTQGGVPLQSMAHKSFYSFAAYGVQVSHLLLCGLVRNLHSPHRIPLPKSKACGPR